MELTRLDNNMTAFKLLTILKQELGDDKLLDIDCVHYNLETRGIDLEPKDMVSAVVAFYNNPIPFYTNWEAFDKFVAAFCHYDVNPGTIHKNNMFEIVRAILDAKKIVDTYIKDNINFNSEVLTYIAAIAHDEGLVICPPEIAYTGLQDYMDKINYNVTPDMKKEIMKFYDYLVKAYNEEFAETVDKDINDFTLENALKLLSISLYTKKFD